MCNPKDNMIADLAERDFIVFAGAGIPHESSPPITWPELLAAFKSAEPQLVVREIEKVSEKEYPDYAQEIFDALREKGRESRYYEILAEKLQATNARCSSSQRDIIETARHVVTTNFDDSFKNAMERELEKGDATRTTQSLPDLLQTSLNLDYSVSYLHGSTNERCIVFKTDDYNTFYPSQSDNDRGNDNLEQLLRHLYEERTMVFIGVSFNDEYLLNALSSFFKKVKQNDEVGREQKASYQPKLDTIQHYAFMPEDMGMKVVKGDLQRSGDVGQLINEERKKKVEFLADLKIKVITYRKHVEWTDWFKVIREGHRESFKVSEYKKKTKRVRR